MKSETYSILTPSLSLRNRTVSKVYLSSSNPLKHTYLKIKVAFDVWHNENSWFFWRVLESQHSSLFCLVYDCNPWYHTQLYSVTHNPTLIIKLQTFFYNFQKQKPILYLNANLDRKSFQMSSSVTHMTV